ncbi:ATPase P [Alphaproteobacteria bacterium]|nr:ATPase P [Alphaproteobacteria bacterium]
MAQWFKTLRIVHSVPGRVRVRYRLTSGTPRDEETLSAALSVFTGVVRARVNSAARSLIVLYDSGQTDAARLIQALSWMEAPEDAIQKTGAEAGNAPNPVFFSLAALTVSWLLPTPLRFALSMAAALPIYREAWKDARDSGLTSHGLEALAISISLARADFLAANITTFLLNLGEYMEKSIARRSEELLKNMLRPTSDHVWILDGEKEVLTPAASLIIGDKVVVGAGAVIPVDGTVLQGVAVANEATMTGESASSPKKRGSKVLSGTLVEEGRLVIYAESVGPDTAAARIADYVEHSLQMKSEAQLEASRLADRLVPTVLKLAGASYFLSGGDWRRAASVLQGDYSCALKLSTPVAFKSAMYDAGRSNILIKGATAMEHLSHADVFVFDKTGTLTTGVLDVTDVESFDPAYSSDDVVCLAASVEEHYFHPLSAAVVAAARTADQGRHFDHKEVKFIVAHGVASVIDNKRIVVGSRHFIEEDEGIDLAFCSETIDRLFEEGKTLLYVGFDGRLAGILALKDSPRPEAVQTIRKLRALGVKKILMLSGDHEKRAREMAEQLGLDACYAELLPRQKADIVAGLAKDGAHVAFIGDGINDAPALAGAHVGVAMQRGADIARLTADITLLQDDIGRIADAKEIANNTMALITANYKITVGLNSAILLLAAFGLLSPIATAILHNGATLTILLNALRNRR